MIFGEFVKKNVNTLPYITYQEPLNWFIWNFVLEHYTKICRHIRSL